MGNKIWVSGVALVLAAPLLPIPAVVTVGQVLLVLGAVMICLDK